MSENIILPWWDNMFLSWLYLGQWEAELGLICVCLSAPLCCVYPGEANVLSYLQFLNWSRATGKYQTHTHTHTVVFPPRLGTLHRHTYINFLETYSNPYHYVTNHKPYPNINPSSPNNLMIYFGLAFCPHQEGESPQCDRFMPPQHELFTSTSTHTNQGELLSLQERKRGQVIGL